MTQTAVATRFDYRAACAEVAVPAVQLLPESVFSIYRDLRDAPEFDGLAQRKGDLQVPMPESLRARFEVIPTDVLAFAARALHSLGHWSGRLDADKADKRGAYWKFSNLADGVLRERLGVSQLAACTFAGYHFAIIEGMLRLCASTPDSWTWIECGPATENFLADARAWRDTLPKPPATRYSRHSESWQSFENAAYAVTREAPAELRQLIPGRWIPFLTVGKDYTRPETECTDSCRECGKERRPYSDALLSHSTKCSKFQIPFQLGEARRALAALAAECEKQGLDAGPAKLAAQSLDVYAATPSGRTTPPTCHECLPGEGGL